MKNIYVDIDETICHYPKGRDYYKDSTDYGDAEPLMENIKKINKLYDEGNKITYWTARGSLTGIDWLEITANQLDDWGCLYHELSVGEKPAYDLLICDKTKRIEEI